jgi:hypothetical protein
MNAFAPLPADLDPSADARRERLRERQLQMLDRLAEVGLQIAEAIGANVAQTVQDAPDDAAAERRTARLSAAALAYGRAARAVRMTLALQSKLADAGGGDDASGPIEISWMPDPAQAKAAQVKRVQRIVRRVADDGEPLDAEALERLAAETAERLQDEDLYGDLLRTPVGEVVARICRDLGLDPDWASLAQEPWAQDEIRTRAPASPFAPWMPGGMPGGTDPPPRTPMTGGQRHSSA